MTATASTNTGQAEYWNGRTGQTWAREQARLDHAFAPLTRALLDRAAPKAGETCLDLGCGTGDLTLALARAVGREGDVTGLDLSHPMLTIARSRDADERSVERAPITWLEADAAQVPFQAEFDLVASRFGVMFFADPAAAFGNIRKALRPNGRLAMLCWRGLADNPWATVPRAPILDLVGPQEPSPPDAPGPFAFADPERVRAILGEAGFGSVSAHPVDAAMTIGAGPGGAALTEAVAYVLQIGPAAALLRGAEPPLKEKAREAMTATLAPYLEGDAVRLGAACWIYEAVNPA